MRIAVIGGTGFIGSYLLEALHTGGHSTSVLVRPGSESKLIGGPGVRIVSGDLGSDDAFNELLDGCDAVVYLVGILRAFPDRGITFEDTQYEGVVRVADAAAQRGIRRFLLMSANGVEADSTAYQHTKLNAERYVQGLDLDVTVFRPSVVFGDPRGRMEFATQLCRDMIRMPVPAIGFYSGWRPSTGPVMMSPVHVQDVAEAFVAALDDPASIGETYTLGGPEALSWAEMLRRVAAAVDRRKLIIPFPINLMRIGAMLFDWLPFFPVTRDQLTMLEQNNTCDPVQLAKLIRREPQAFVAANLSYLRD